MESIDFGLIDNDVDARCLLPQQFALVWGADLSDLKHAAGAEIVLENRLWFVAKVNLSATYRANVSFFVPEGRLEYIELDVYVRTWDLDEAWSINFADLRKTVFDKADSIFSRLVDHVLIKLGPLHQRQENAEPDIWDPVLRRCCWSLEESQLCAELYDSGQDHPIIVRLKCAPIDAI